MTRIPQLRRNERPRQTRQIWPVVFVGVIVVLGLAGMLSQGQISRAINQPLGPTLPPMEATNGLTPVVMQVSEGGLAAVVPTPTPANPIANLISAPLPNANAKCGGPTQMILLLIGSDNASGFERGLSDAIRLVRLDFSGGTISTLAIPRDLWVKIPDLNHSAEVDMHNLLGDMLDDHGNPMYPPGDYGKINVSYFYGDLYNYPGRGPGELARTILLNLGVHVDHYLVINMGVFPQLIDAVGGIDVNVPKDIHDPEKGWGFYKGVQHMDGEIALDYARTRMEDTDWDRMGRQDQIIMAYRDKVLQPQVWPQIPGIIDQFLSNVSTDLSRGDITTMTCLVGQVPREQVRNFIIDSNLVTVAHSSTGSYVMLPQPVPIGKMVYQFLYGVSY